MTQINLVNRTRVMNIENTILVAKWEGRWQIELEVGARRYAKDYIWTG